VPHPLTNAYHYLQYLFQVNIYFHFFSFFLEVEKLSYLKKTKFEEVVMASGVWRSHLPPKKSGDKDDLFGRKRRTVSVLTFDCVTVEFAIKLL
jgi:hypothetical protein